MSSLVPPLLHQHHHHPSPSTSPARLLPPQLQDDLSFKSHHDKEATTNAAITSTSRSSSASALRLRARLRQLCKDGRLDCARRLLEARPRPAPTLLCNTLLIGYVSHSLPDQALHLYSLLNHSNPNANPFRSDHYTYSSALTACARTRRLLLGKSIHCHLLRRSPSPPKNTVLNNSLLNVYASCSSNVARSLFDRMPNRNAISWNTIFAWYVKTRRPHEALALLKLMLQAGIRPTPVSFVNVFPAAGLATYDPNWSLLLYGLLVKHGTEFVQDLFVVSSAISMFSELRDTQSARRVFDRAAKKNTEVWNTMMTGYVQNRQFVEAIHLFVQILESGEVAVDAVTLLLALVAVSQAQDIALGQQVHAYLIKEKLDSLPVILCNALIVMYSRCGYVQSAFELFHQMLERDVVSWNTMISAFVQNDFNFEGLLLIYEMQKSGFGVDSVGMIALLSAASNLGDLQIGKQAHGYLIRHGIQCEGMESYLVDMYSKSGHVEMARRLFGGCRPDKRDEATWNAMIAGYTQNDQAEQAIQVFRAMLEEDLEPNSVTLSSILPACDPIGGVCAGRQIHGFAVRRCLDTNVFVGTALVDMYSKCGEISAAERVFGGMTEKSTVTYTTMLSGFGQHGLGTRALSLFHSMREVGIKPDAVTFLAVISACSYSGLVEEGLALYKSMDDLGIVATPQHHCCVVDLLARAGRVEEAYEFAQGLGEDGNFVAIWGSLLASCKAHKKLELGKLVSERLLEIEKEYGVAGYNVLLSHLCAAESNWSNADRVRKEMRERGMRKEPGSSWIEVEDATHRFMARDQKHPENDQIFSMLQELTSEMKSSGHKPQDYSFAEEDTELD